MIIKSVRVRNKEKNNIRGSIVKNRKTKDKRTRWYEREGQSEIYKDRLRNIE